MSESRRTLRVERELRERLSQIISSELKIPLPGLVTIVEVSVSDDLRNAKVYLRVPGGEREKSEAETLLMSQRTWIQNRVGQDLKLRFSPVLKFLLGSAPQVSQNDEVEQMLANLRRRA